MTRSVFEKLCAKKVCVDFWPLNDFEKNGKRFLIPPPKKSRALVGGALENFNLA